MNGPPTAPARLGELLVRAGSIQPAELEQALAFQRTQGGRIGAVLVRLGALSEDSLYRALAEQLALPLQPLADLSPDGVRAGVAALGQPASWWLPRAALPWLDDAGVLFVAAADPLEGDLREAVDAGRGERAVCWCLAQPAALDRWQQTLRGNELQVATDLDARALREMAEDAPVIAFVNNVLAQAVDARASDIHFEPGEREFDVRFRIDGVLQARGKQPMSRYPAISSRLKLVSGLDIAERRVPQDGRFRIRVSGKEIDLRVSVLPTVYGEKIVMRLLDKGNLQGSLEQLGLDDYTFNVFKKAIDAPHGMILITGPTGSGKTTTLYTILGELNDPKYNVVTVEDPVEYQLVGINQVAVKSDIGMGFSEALRSILRQDPDIVMIGEIRDNETADIAVKAALTGHQVLSTLHTNDAAGAITRMDDMGIEPFLISSSVILTCAQRLVRRICPNCREEFQPEPELLAKLGIEDEGTIFYKGAGCGRCKNRGYLGRAAIIEVLPITEAIRRLVIKRASASVVKNQAISEGMKTLRMVGIEKAREGITTLEEILAVTSEDH